VLPMTNAVLVEFGEYWGNEPWTMSYLYVERWQLMHAGSMRQCRVVRNHGAKLVNATYHWRMAERPRDGSWIGHHVGRGRTRESDKRKRRALARKDILLSKEVVDYTTWKRRTVTYLTQLLVWKCVRNLRRLRVEFTWDFWI